MGEVPISWDPWDVLLFVLVFPIALTLTWRRWDPPVPVETIIIDVLIG
jgi:hypothetical protein